jgi:hypothetical protein
MKTIVFSLLSFVAVFGSGIRNGQNSQHCIGICISMPKLTMEPSKDLSYRSSVPYGLKETPTIS